MILWAYSLDIFGATKWDTGVASVETDLPVTVCSLDRACPTHYFEVGVRVKT